MDTVTDRLARGESVPGAPGACATCGHLTLWHMNGQRRYRGKPCQKCDCRAFTAAGEEPPSGCMSTRLKTPTEQADQLALFTVEEVK